MIEFREPFPEWGWAMAWEWASKRRHQLADDFFPRSQDEFVEGYSRAFSKARTLGLWKDGSLGGAIIFVPDSPVVATAHILLSRRLWGTPAVELRGAAALMFESQPELIRIQAFVPAWNRLAIAQAKRLGGSVEGILRAATMRDGNPADAVVVGITREDFFDGLEPGRIGRRVELQLDEQQQRIDEQHVFAGADLPSEQSGQHAIERSGYDRVGGDDAGSDGGGDSGRGPDQQNGERNRRKNAAVSRVPRVRIERADGRGGAPDRARKTKQPRRKRK
jgi:RimJ/RimL family protein N-acetyltransferase